MLNCHRHAQLLCYFSHPVVVSHMPDQNGFLFQSCKRVDGLLEAQQQQVHQDRRDAFVDMPRQIFNLQDQLTALVAEVAALKARLAKYEK